MRVRTELKWFAASLTLGGLAYVLSRRNGQDNRAVQLMFMAAGAILIGLRFSTIRQAFRTTFKRRDRSDYIRPRRF